MHELIRAEEVIDTVRTAVAETLRVERDAVRPESSIVAELGAESLDILDVNYRIEQHFGIRMARHFFLDHAEELLGDGSVVDDEGYLTDQGLALLARRYGPVALRTLGKRVSLDDVAALITVQAVADAVVDILGTLPERCPCGAVAWERNEAPQVVCGACLEPARFEDGDRRIRRWLEAALLTDDVAG